MTFLMNFINMSEEMKARRAFHEDIFAEEADKWSWKGSVSSAKASGSGVVYDTHTSEVKSDSSSSDNSDRLGFVFRQRKNFRGSSSASEGNQDEVSSSSRPSGGTTRERLLPSIYDDDAQSGSPSGVFEKKDLAFRSSFKKSLDSPPNCSLDGSLFSSAVDGKSRKQSTGRECSADKRSSLSPKRKDSRDSRSKRSPFDRKIKSSRSRSKSRDKKYRRRSRSKSRSKSKDRRGKSPQVRRRSRSRDRPSDRRRYSRSRRSPSRESRRRSRSRSYDRQRRRNHYRSSSRDRHRRRRYSRSRSHSRDRSKGSGGRKPGSLPLSTSGGAITPQMALQQTMAAMSAKAQAMTGIALPKYYNPAAVNPIKYAEQVQKRKLLWQTKEKVEEAAPKNSVWDKLTFAQDQDGKMTAKFRKLMGIKSDGTSAEGEDKEGALKKQEELFRDLDQQYEMARMTTHTQRGVGLGYSAQTLYPPIQK